MNFAEITINYKPLRPLSEMPKVSSSRQIFEVLSNYWSDKIAYKEEFKILLFNTSCKLLGISNISEGGINMTAVDLRLIFQAALKANATCIVLAHNHPSGSFRPSDADLNVTKKISEAGRILDIKVLDHIILTPDNQYFSFADEGYL